MIVTGQKQRSARIIELLEYSLSTFRCTVLAEFCVFVREIAFLLVADSLTMSVPPRAERMHVSEGQNTFLRVVGEFRIKPRHLLVLGLCLSIVQTNQLPRPLFGVRKFNSVISGTLPM